MEADNSQSMSVSWSQYGKILQNNKAGGANLTFGYNAMQQRVLKRVVLAGDTTRTYYIRDAQGNTMGVYTRHNDSVSWREQYIFGSSRLGLYRADTLVNKGLTVISKLYEGKRNYELTNHLGNVMAVINDRKTDSLSGTTKVGFNAVVISATDYYPFGMAIDSRSYTSSLYRYGFNGKENDKETGEQDYGIRMYDPRIAKFLSIDPISKKFPELSPYQFASNTPIQAVDMDGKEAYPYFSNNTNFITLVNVDFMFVTRQSEKTLTASFPDSPTKTDYSVNTQMYDKTKDALYGLAITPQPVGQYTPQGFNVMNGNVVSGRSSPNTFYFSRDNSGKWSTGQGDVPSDSNFGFGGGTPLIVGGLKYGTTNIFSEKKEGMLEKGPVSPEHQQYLLQKSNGVYPGQNEASKGKTILAYRSKDRIWKIISQQDGTSGYTLDEIRDHLYNDGFDHVLSFDGASSSTLVKDGTTIVNPRLQKNNTMPAGINLSVPSEQPQEKKQKK